MLFCVINVIRDQFPFQQYCGLDIQIENKIKRLNIIYIFIIILYSLWNLEMWLVMHYLHIFLLIESSFIIICVHLKTFLRFRWEILIMSCILCCSIWHFSLKYILASKTFLLLKSTALVVQYIVSILASSVVDRGLETQSDQSKDYKIGICCFSAKHTSLRRKRKVWLSQNHDNVSKWGNISIRGLFFQWASTRKIQLSVLVLYKACIIISLKINLFSPWYS